MAREILIKYFDYILKALNVIRYCFYYLVKIILIVYVTKLIAVIDCVLISLNTDFLRRNPLGKIPLLPA